MQLPKRLFEEHDAVLSSVPLWVCMFGPSGCGKTYSALEIATGVQKIRGGDIAVIDTEGNRALAYSKYFKFKHWPLVAPFGSLDYLAVIQQAYAKGRRIIIVDSMSHEHEGPGGLLDLQEAEVRRMAGDDWQKAERVKMLAWTKPKQHRRALLNGMTAMTDVTFILCFRAADVSKPIKAKDGKTEVLHMGFTPIGAREFVYESTVSFFLPPASKGTFDPVPENVGEKMMMKVPRQFEELLAKPHQLSARDGEQLARWAKGDDASTPPASRTAAPTNDKPRSERIAAALKFLGETTTKKTRGGDPVPASKVLEERYARPEIRALYAECSEDERMQLDAKYNELRESFLEREAIEEESR